MENIKNSYESVVVFSLKSGDAKIKENVDKFKELIEKNGTLNKIDDWGKRDLAYLINKESEGYYILFDFEAEAKFPAELERIFRITDGILRFLVVKKES